MKKTSLELEQFMLIASSGRQQKIVRLSTKTLQVIDHLKDASLLSNEKCQVLTLSQLRCK